MRIAVASDEPYAVHDTIVREIERRGHEVVPSGALVTGHDVPWAPTAEAVALAVAHGECDEGVLLCWSGTGVSIAANKVAGVRAALCADAQTAAAARIWNHANVLCLSNRTLSPDVAREILAAWFATPRGDKGEEGVAALAAVDERHRRTSGEGPER